MADSVASFRRELEVFLDETLSEEGQRKIFVGIAQAEIAKFEAEWIAALGQGAAFERFVDGARRQDIEAVGIPNGVVAERVRALAPVVDRALELFDLFTKTVTGGYKSETVVFVGGNRVTGKPSPAPGQSVSIVNLSPFARKAEVRSFNDKDDSGFRNGLFESLASLLFQEFKGSSVQISFGFDNFAGRRLPQIEIA